MGQMQKKKKEKKRILIIIAVYTINFRATAQIQDESEGLSGTKV